METIHELQSSPTLCPPGTKCKAYTTIMHRITCEPHKILISTAASQWYICIPHSPGICTWHVRGNLYIFFCMYTWKRNGITVYIVCMHVHVCMPGCHELIDGLIDWLTLIDWLIDRSIDKWVGVGWVSEWVSERASEQMSEWVGGGKERASEQASDLAERLADCLRDLWLNG